MRFLTEEPARLYTNQKPIPLQIEGKKYHVSLVYERNGDEYYPKYLFYQGKVHVYEDKPIRNLNGYPISDHILFLDDKNTYEVVLKCRTFSYEELLQSQNWMTLEDYTLLEEWFSLIYPLYKIQEKSYFLFEHYFCKTVWELLDKVPNYQRKITEKLMKYFLNISLFIQQFEYENTFRNPFPILIQTEEQLDKKEFELLEEIQLRNEFLSTLSQDPDWVPKEKK